MSGQNINRAINSSVNHAQNKYSNPSTYSFSITTDEAHREATDASIMNNENNANTLGKKKEKRALVKTLRNTCYALETFKTKCSVTFLTTPLAQG